MNSMILHLQNSLKSNKNRTAFFINGAAHSYGELLERVDVIRSKVKYLNEPLIGVETNDDLDTYASILAIWMEGKGFVPCNPSFPIQRINAIIEEVGIKTVLSSEGNTNYRGANLLKSGSSEKPDETAELSEINGANLAYVIFTSGSTGVPKGVPISFKQLESFVNNHQEVGVQLNEDDRVLQMFDLTFDLSIVSFLLPLLSGASVYTVPKDEIKYISVFQLLTHNELTHALFVPSLLRFLLPLLKGSELPALKTVLFCGEALEAAQVEEFSSIAHTARIFNVYGPTEGTIYCSSYLCSGEESKSKNGVLSIGRPFGNTEFYIVNEAGTICTEGEKGELYLAGEQIISNYWNNLNASQFTRLNDRQVYKTGDLVLSEKGNYYYLGRVDSQVKIGGFRVEIAEVEFHLNTVLKGRKFLAFTKNDPNLGTLLCAVVEGEVEDMSTVLLGLKAQMPAYMIPQSIKSINQFVYNSNGKVDRSRTVELLSTEA